MRHALPALGALCLAAITTACDLSTGPKAETVTISGFVGRGVFSDSIGVGMPFQLFAPDSSGQNSGDLLMAGDMLPPTGTYDIDTGQYPDGFSSLAVAFVRPTSSTSSELYQPASGNMVITTTAGDSIAGTLGFTLLLTKVCSGPADALTCQQVNLSNKQLKLDGTFLVRRAPPDSFPAS